MTEEEAKAVELPRVSRFLQSELGRRILAAETVYREKRFTAVIPAQMAEPECEGAQDESVILQGAVDCAFVENGVLHIVDFKTDRVKTGEELAARYAPQLRLYAAAMQEVLDMPVGQLLLYSFRLHEIIEITP